MTTRTYGISSLIWRVAASPSWPGRLISIKMTSGINSLALSIASKPSAA